MRQCSERDTCNQEARTRSANKGARPSCSMTAQSLSSPHNTSNASISFYSDTVWKLLLIFRATWCSAPESTRSTSASPISPKPAISGDRTCDILPRRVMRWKQMNLVLKAKALCPVVRHLKISA